MALVFQVLSLGDLDEVFGFAENNLKRRVPDDVERTFQLWSSRWRREALEHYLKLGWSFVARHEDASTPGHGRTAGFFLGQPFLFFRGQTQTLWIEQLEADGPESRDALIDVAVRVAREKHLQRVLFSADDSGSNVTQLESGLERWSPARLTDTIIEVRTTKG